jgi:hypothetical protein
MCDEKDVQVLHFSGDRQNEHGNTPSAIVKTFLCQLLETRPELCEELQKWLSITQTRLDQTPDNASELWHQFRRILSADTAGITYCVIDGLEELDDEGVKEIVGFMSTDFPCEGCSGKNAALRVVALSRQGQPTERFSAIDLDAEVSKADKLNFPQEMSGDDIRSQFGAFDDELKKRYTKTFRYASVLQIQSTTAILAGLLLSTKEDVRKDLNNVPMFVELRGNKVLLIHRTIRDTFANVDAPKNDKDKFYTCINEVHVEIARRCRTILKELVFARDLTALKTINTAMAQKTASKMPELYYVVVHWASHTRLSSDDPEDLLDRIMRTFTDSRTATPAPSLQKRLIHFLLFKHDFTTQELRTHRYAPEGWVLENDREIRNDQAAREDKEAKDDLVFATTLMHVFIRFSFTSLLQAAQKSRTHWPYFFDTIGPTDYMRQDALHCALFQCHPETTTWMFDIVPNQDCWTHYSFACGTNATVLESVWQDWLARAEKTFVDETGETRTTFNSGILEGFFDKAIHSGDVDVVRCLIERLRSVDAARENLPWASTLPPKWAIQNGYVEMIEPLLGILDMNKESAVIAIEFAVPAHEPTSLRILLKSQQVKCLMSCHDPPILRREDLVEAMGFAVTRVCLEMIKTLNGEECGGHGC